MTEPITAIYKIQIPIVTNAPVSQVRALAYTRRYANHRGVILLPDPDYINVPIDDVLQYFNGHVYKIYAECVKEPFQVLRVVEDQDW